MQTKVMGMVGLGVMGRALAENFSRHGWALVVYDRDQASAARFVGTQTNMTLAVDLENLMRRLPSPRCIVVLVPAGQAVDQVLDSLSSLVTKHDVVVDLGNSHWQDTERRYHALRDAGVRFVGCGISGGEEGARHGPALMPGGDERAWPAIRAAFQAVAAKVDGQPCCEWIGAGGAGHYVKMVHNGIEYADMQLIAEVYQLMSSGLGLSHERMAGIFADFNAGRLESYLIEITADILRKRDTDGTPLVEKVRDAAKQKGTGMWTGIASLQLGVPTTLITEAVYARAVSAMKAGREQLATLYAAQDDTESPLGGVDSQAFVRDLEDAVYAAKLVCYAQGFMLLQTAAKEHGWPIDCAAVARIWRGGCIIRSRFLNHIRDAYRREPGLENLLLDPHFIEAISNGLPAWRRVVTRAIGAGMPVPALSSGLAYIDAVRSAHLPANLIQAQRDYFGAHTYERIDAPEGVTYHSDWQNPEPD